MNRDEVIEKIAKIIGVPTLKAQGVDRADFHEISVWELKKALEMAYEAGKESK